MYKIVDSFNGWDGGERGERFQTMETAEKVLALHRENFRKYNTPNAIFKQIIVPANYTWYFDQKINRWKWGQ